MKVRILWVGKTKEAFLAEGIGKYLALLQPHADVRVVEIKEEKGGKDPVRVLRREGERIVKQAETYVLLDERGREMTSEELAGFLGDRPRVDFVVGGPHGVSEDVRRRAAATLALSRMTLTHEMARLLLLEQLYRAVTIKAGTGYHH
ncbi:MAG: 23S rRNA (pseudouridine(1915)-N(3))-methyltransferase RlmH [Nitrospirota bacterium]|jgi:23S rRNA (pseudouridine1915-N3)-methyltransferase